MFCIWNPKIFELFIFESLKFVKVKIMLVSSSFLRKPLVSFPAIKCFVFRRFHIEGLEFLGLV